MENLLLILGILLIIGALVYFFAGSRKKDEVTERLDRYALGVEEKRRSGGNPAPGSRRWESAWIRRWRSGASPATCAPNWPGPT